MNYLDKYKGQNGRRSVYDIMNLDPNSPADWGIISQNYKANGIDRVRIGGDYFTNYGDFQFIWEKSYVKSPQRSASGAIDNLNSYATFVTPHLIINFAVMSIDDYRALMRKDLSQNEFEVECYDPIYNRMTTQNMYFATPSMAKLRTIAKKRFNQDEWEEFVELVGVEGYTVELIGTNTEIGNLSVIYHLNPPISGINEQNYAEPNVYKGQDIVIGTSASAIVNETFDGRYKFAKWTTDPNNKEQGVFTNGNVYTITYDLDLYAQWDSVTNHTLSFSYGVADPVINGDTNTYETSRTVVQNKSIGTLPIPADPVVKAKDLNGKENEYKPYYGGAWYKTPIKASNSTPISDNATYWTNRDSTIYRLYSVNKYTLKLYLEGSLYQNNYVEYNTAMNLPALVKDGYTFDGWYYTSDFKENTKASGLMPPYALTLYARWIKK
jgi:uncharacterized repeat protein (TIGR02543 family)